MQKLQAAGGVVMGKTRMHELAYGVTSISPAFGPVSNPYDVTKIPGGAPEKSLCWPLACMQCLREKCTRRCQ